MSATSNLIRDWLNLGAAIATALFTGTMAWLAWRARGGQIVVEWEFSYEPGPESIDHLSARITVRNYASFSVMPYRIDVSGVPVKETRDTNLPEQNNSKLPANAAALGGRAIEPNSSASWSVFVIPDWAALVKRSRSWKGQSARFQITVVSRSNRRWRKRIFVKMTINAEIIEKNAATLAAKVASKN